MRTLDLRYFTRPSSFYCDSFSRTFYRCVWPVVKTIFTVMLLISCRIFSMYTGDFHIATYGSMNEKKAQRTTASDIAKRVSGK